MAITPQTLNPDTFARLVLEKGLKVVEHGQDGYKYAIDRQQKDAVLYRTACVDWDKIPITSAQSNNPAAGATPTATTCSTGKRWLVIGASVTLTTDANVANRYPLLTVITSTGRVLYFAQDTPITASITGQIVSFAAGCCPGGAIGNGLVYATPAGTGIEVLAGGSIGLSLINIQAADDLGAVTYFYKEAPA